MMTKKTLAQYGVDFVEKNIEEDPEALAFLRAEWFQAVPVLFAEGMEPVQGFRPDVLTALAKAQAAI
jgi:glutaredoxin-like protein NrdH